MSFRLLGIRIRIGASFLLLQLGLAVFISLTLPTTAWLKTVAFVIVSAIVLVSVLVHEMGHALAARSAGLRPEVTLTWFGGYTRFVANVGPARRLWISAAGVVLQAAMAGVVWILIRQGLFGESEIVVTIAEAFVLFNLVMAGINLIPVGGMDGGAILGSVLELLNVPRPRLALLVIYGVGGVVITVIALVTVNWILVLAGLYLTYVGLRSQLPAVRFEQDAAAHPDLEATVRRLLVTHRFDDVADVARQALDAADSPPYRVFATTVLLDALRLASASDELASVLDSADLAGIDRVTVARAQEAAGRHDEAVATLSEVIATDDAARGVAALIAAYLHAGEAGAAVEVLARNPGLVTVVDGLDLHADLVEHAPAEATRVREILSARRDMPLGAIATMLIEEGAIVEGVAMLRRDHELAANRTTGAWMDLGMHLAGGNGAPVRTEDLPGELDATAASVLVHLHARSERHDAVVDLGLPVVRAGRSPGSLFDYQVAASLDALGRTADALDVLRTIPAERLLGVLAERDDFARARQTGAFADLVESVATARI